MNEEESLKTEEFIENVINIKFQKLTPEKNLGEPGLAGYREALDYALSDDDIVNIALTGVYGSGKSSILESYKKDTNLKFLHISLAHFENRVNEASEVAEQNNSIQNKDLEGKILNQLLHQIDSRNIPQTIFRTKKKVKKISVFLITSLFLLSMLSILYLLNVSPLVNYLNLFFLDIYNIQSFFSVPSKDAIDKLAIIIVISSSFYLIYKLIITQLNKRIFKGFSFKSAGVESDIEIFAETEASYFDKFLDDVLYLFVQSKADVIVFEDIDRFEEEGIFEKLKEINTLVNNKLMSDNRWIRFKKIHKKNRKLRFIYLLKDDLFLSKDRTKFFDFIIPVVPVVTSTNSYEKLKELLDSSLIHEKFNRNFLQKVSLYIDDMRLMKNIYNEFLIYSRRINIDKLRLSNNELFAILTYKNIFPKDFSDLLFNRGFVYNLFKGKEEYIVSREDELKEKIRILQKRIKDAENELVSSIDDLMFLYLPYTLRIGNNKYQEHFSSGGQFISELRKTQDAIYHVQNNNNWYTITFEEITDKIEDNTDFIERKKKLLDRQRKQKIQEEIVDLEMELSSIKNSKLKNIISREQIIELAKEDYQIIEKNEYFDLIIFLIHNGYINEGYSDYITYFYDNSLRINDKNFLRSIADEKGLIWNFALTEQMNVKEELLDRMDNSDFLKTESLNFDLFEYMISMQSNPAIVDYLDIYFNMIKKQKKIKFIIESFFYYSDTTQKELILSILKYKCSLFTDIFSSDYFSDEQMSKFSVAVLSFMDNNQFESSGLSTSSTMRDFISTADSFLSSSINVNDYLIKNLATLLPRFKLVNFSEIDTNIGQAIFSNNLYEINFSNLYNALNHFFEKSDYEEVKYKNYSVLCNLSDKSILNYIEEPNEIGNYVAQYISFSNGKIDDHPDIAYRLINNKNLSIPELNNYISCLKTNALELDKVTYKENYLSIIKHAKARANEINIINYFVSQENEWTDELIEFIKDERAEYSFDRSKANELIEKGKVKSFFAKTAQNNNIPNEIYKDIIMKINEAFTDFANEKISVEKIEILIKYNKITLTEESLQTFRDSYSEQLIKFILKNIGEYIEYVQSINLTEEENTVYHEELYVVLKHGQNLPVEQQKELVDCFEEDEKISINNGYFSNELKAYILSNYFNSEDLEYVCETYDKQPEIVQVEIYKQVQANQLTIIDKDIAIPKGLLEVILNDENMELENKQLLMSKNIKNIELDKLVAVFNSLDLSKFTILFNKKEPTFEKNETNKNILAHLDNKNIISSFRDVNGKYKAFNRHKKSNFKFRN